MPRPAPPADGATPLVAVPLASDRVSALYAGAMAASQLQDHARAEALGEQALDLARSTTPREPRAERAVSLLQAQLHHPPRGQPAAASEDAGQP